MGWAISQRRGSVFCAAFALVALALLWWATMAGTDISLCPPGEGAGQCGAPRGLAADTEKGLLYVADEAHDRISVFKDNGEFHFAFGWGVRDGTAAPQTCGPGASPPSASCLKGLGGSGPGQLDRPAALAVDNSGSPSKHAIYVSELGVDEGPGASRHPRVQKFDSAGEFVWMIGEGVDQTDGGDLCTKAEGHVCGKGAESSEEGGFVSAPSIAVGPGGVLYAVDDVLLPGNIRIQRLQRFEPSGAQIPPETILQEGTSAVRPRAIAVDAAGDLWVTSQNAGLRKHCAPGWASCAGPFQAGVGFATNALAIDAGGDLYAAQSELRDNGFDFFNVIAAFDPTTGDVLRRFAYTARNGGANAINGLAVHESPDGKILFSPASEEVHYVFEPPPGPVPAAPSLEVPAGGLGSTKATLVAEVNPEGKASEVQFQYVDEATYLKDVEELGPGHGFDHAKSTNFEPLAGGATGFNLKTAEALIGCLDPENEAELPESPCLLPDTTYRWQVVAKNADGEGPGGVEGPPFTTGKSPELGEIWATRVGTDTARLHAEVKPNLIPATGFFEYVDDATFQASGFAEASKAPLGTPLDFGAGEAFTSRSVVVYPLDPGTTYHFRLVADNALIDPVQGEAEELHTFSPPEVDPCANGASRIGPAAFLPDCRAYEMVSPPEKEGGGIRVLLTDQVPAVLEQSSLAGEKLAYGSVRSFGGAASAPYTSQYIARRLEGKEWETHPINSPRGAPIFTALQQTETEFQAFSVDLCEAWVESFAEPPLTLEALAGYSNIYRRTDELCSKDDRAHYEALAPLEEPASLPPGPEFFTRLLGVSEDGEQAAFTASDAIAPGGSAGEEQLYEHARGSESPGFVCVLPGGEAVSGSCTAGSGTPSNPGAQIGRISSDGERIFWSTLTGSGEGKLYVRIDPDPAIEGDEQTRAVSEGGEEQSGTSRSWFWGAASDGSTAIFSTEVGANDSDLYEFDVDLEETSLIAGGVLGVLGIGEDAARVYFASSEVLSGEEANSNGDKAQAGKANLYVREAGGGIEFIATLASGDLERALQKVPFRKHTARVSPDGAHAVFTSVAPLSGYDNKGAESKAATEQVYRYDATADELLCVSCNPSRARPAGGSSIPFWQSPMHATRVLSEDGSRLYFESADALAARDTNGKVDVYQWEEPGSGGCDEDDGSFSPEAGGCVEPVSSGQGHQDSRFIEASPSGDDVFFATVESLLPQDIGVVDIYDARVGGGLPIPPPKKPVCEGDTCAAQVAPPEEPTPASAGYVAPPASPESSPAKRRRCAKGKRRVKRKGKVRCIAKRKAKHSRGRAR
jgi:hypothetical protein